ncbi:MAG: ATP-binding cassette domain-containing protein, partial [Pseudomonadota bacterium]
MRRIGKTFGNGVVALSDTDLTLNEGDFLSLVGPSGCGKSTALRIVSGLSQPTSGRLEWGGEPLGKGDIGFVFQEATLLPWAS